MTHLSDADLREWMAYGRAADRDRVIGHLAECEPCRRALSVLAQEPVDISVPAELVAAHEVSERGYAAYAAEKPGAGWWSWLRPAYGLAAAVVVLAVGTLAMWPAAPAVDDSVRGSAIQLIAPTGAVAELPEFRWASPIEAPRYRVVVQTAAGLQLLAVDTTDQRLAASAEARARLSGQGPLQWHVEALDEQGAVIARSTPVRFVVGS